MSSDALPRNQPELYKLKFEGSPVEGRRGRPRASTASASIGLFLRKSLVLALSLVSRTYLPFIALGVINRLGKPIRSVFLCYAGNAQYARQYCFEWTEGWLRWLPTPIGIYRQGRYWGVVFASPMNESEFTDPANQRKLNRIIRRLQLIGKYLSADKVQLAGILPSYIERTLPDVNVESGAMTAKALAAAVSELKRTEFNGSAVPIILLGGNGKVGRLLQVELKNIAQESFVVDPNGGLGALPPKLCGPAALLIDVSRAGTIKKYLGEIWPELRILNETFPEPQGATLRLLRKKGVRVFHLSGVGGAVFPQLPMGYFGSVPCCAIHDDEGGLRPVLSAL